MSRDTNFANAEIKGTDVDRFRISMDFGKWDYDFSNMQEVINGLYRVLKKGGTIICFYDVWKITTLKTYLETSGFQ